MLARARRRSISCVVSFENCHLCLSTCEGSVELSVDASVVIDPAFVVKVEAKLRLAGFFSPALSLSSRRRTVVENARRATWPSGDDSFRKPRDCALTLQSRHVQAEQLITSLNTPPIRLSLVARGAAVPANRKTCLNDGCIVSQPLIHPPRAHSYLSSCGHLTDMSSDQRSACTSASLSAFSRHIFCYLGSLTGWRLSVYSVLIISDLTTTEPCKDLDNQRRPYLSIQARNATRISRGLFENLHSTWLKTSSKPWNGLSRTQSTFSSPTSMAQSRCKTAMTTWYESSRSQEVWTRLTDNDRQTT